MIESNRTGVDLGISSHIQAEVVEFKLGWQSRFWAAITGRVRVRAIPEEKPMPGWYIDPGIILPAAPKAVIMDLVSPVTVMGKGGLVLDMAGYDDDEDDE